MLSSWSPVWVLKKLGSSSEQRVYLKKVDYWWQAFGSNINVKFFPSSQLPLSHEVQQSILWVLPSWSPHLQLRINGIKDHGVKSLKQNQHKSFLPTHSQAFAKVMQMESHAISLKNLNCRRICYYCSDPNALELVLRSAVIGLSLDLIKYAKKFYLNKYLLMKRLRGKYLLRLGLFWQW